MAADSLRPLWAFVFAIAIAVLHAGVPAEAQTPVQQCGTKAAIISETIEPWNEVLVASGVVSHYGHKLEIYIGPGGTFTVLLAPSDNVRCLVAVGRDIELHHRAAAIPGKDT